MKKKTILVVEDFGSVRNFICETLIQRGYETLDACNGTEAYNLLLQKGDDVDLVITDYNMPDGTGYELLCWVKANLTLSKIPIIFLTTESNPARMLEAKNAGLKAWIKKPYRREIFFQEIERAMPY